MTVPRFVSFGISEAESVSPAGGLKALPEKFFLAFA